MIKDGMPVKEYLITEDNFDEETEEVKIDENIFKLSDLNLLNEIETNNDNILLYELNEKIREYVKEIFKENGSFLIHQSKDENEIKIHILGQILKPKNFWSGHWHSTWNIKFESKSKSKSKSKSNEEFTFSINGKIELIVHYHEEGSVQLSSSKEITSKVNFKCKTIPESVDKIYWKIRDSENEVQLALNESYQQLADNIFKKLRRQLPVTRTKMDWMKFIK